MGVFCRNLDKLIIAEKHSVGENIAKVIGASNKKDGYIEGNGFIVTWCVGHLVGLSLPDSYGEEYSDYWTFDNLPIIPSSWKFSLDPSKAKQFKIIKKADYLKYNKKGSDINE